MIRPLPDYKIIITDNVYEIPQRLKKYDKSFFVVFNKLSGKFEVHSTDNIWNTYCFTVPFNELDQRTLDIVIKNDTNKKGPKDFIKEIEGYEEKHEKRKDRERKNWIEDVAKETYPYFKKDLDHEFIGMPNEKKKVF